MHQTLHTWTPIPSTHESTAFLAFHFFTVTVMNKYEKAFSWEVLTRAAFRKWLTTHINGHTADVYQVNKYWQSAVSWRNSGMPSFTCGWQWKKMVEDTNFDLSLPHLESDESTTSKSSSTTRRKPYHLLLPWEHSINTRPWKVMYLFCSLHFAVSADELMLLCRWSHQLLWNSGLSSSQEKSS